MNKQKKNNEKEITELKSKYEALLFKQKLSIEHEFDLYREIWKDLSEFQHNIEVFNVYYDGYVKKIIKDKKEISMPEKIKKIHFEHAQKIMDSGNKMIKAIESNRPFYTKIIRNYLYELFHLLTISNYQKWLIIDDKKIVTNIKDIRDKVEKIALKIENAIRDRIEKISL